MNLLIKVFGISLIEISFTKPEKKEVKAGDTFYNCYFDNKQPIIQPIAQNIQSQQKGAEFKNVKLEDYEAMVQVIAEKTGQLPEKIREIINMTTEFLEGLSKQ